MDTNKIQEVHEKIIDLYNSSISPIIKKYFGNIQNSTEEKDGKGYANTLVSSADLEINNVLVKNLPIILSDASVLSEESDSESLSENLFIIDPIDGTHSFLRNLDDWGISIVLICESKVVYSIIFYPNSKTKYYYAIKNNGLFDSDNKKIDPTKYFAFKPSLVSAPSSRKIGRELINFTEGKMISFRAYGSAVYSGYTLFRGGNDLIIYDGLNSWDILGCVFMAQESGFNIHWFSEQPKLNQIEDLKNKRLTLMIYKPDFDKVLLEEIKSIILSTK